MDEHRKANPEESLLNSMYQKHLQRFLIKEYIESIFPVYKVKRNYREGEMQSSDN